jgi:hypothetical protein
MWRAHVIKWRFSSFSSNSTLPQNLIWTWSAKSKDLFLWQERIMWKNTTIRTSPYDIWYIDFFGQLLLSNFKIFSSHRHHYVIPNKLITLSDFFRFLSQKLFFQSLLFFIPFFVFTFNQVSIFINIICAFFADILLPKK